MLISNSPDNSDPVSNLKFNKKGNKHPTSYLIDLAISGKQKQNQISRFEVSFRLRVGHVDSYLEKKNQLYFETIKIRNEENELLPEIWRRQKCSGELKLVGN